MKTATIHTFDDADGGALDGRRVAEALSLLAGAIDTATEDALKAGIRSPDGLDPADFEGLRAVRKIRGGSFATEDVAAFRDYVGVLAARRRKLADEVEREGRAPAPFVAAMRDGAAHAERIADEFVAAFRMTLEEGAETGMSAPAP